VQARPIAPFKQNTAWLLPAADFILSYGVWAVFFYIRKTAFEHSVPVVRPLTYVLPAIIAAAWVLLYGLYGLYDARNAAPARVLAQLVKACVVGVLVLFFATFLDDPVTSGALRWMAIDYFALQLVTISVGRVVLGLYQQARKNADGKHVLLIGSGTRAQALLAELRRHNPALAAGIVGFVNTDAQPQAVDGLKPLGGLDDLQPLLLQYTIDVALLVPDALLPHPYFDLIQVLQRNEVRIQLPPELYDAALGGYHIHNMVGAPLIELHRRHIAPWEATLKRTGDVVVSAVLLVLLSPLFGLLALAIRLTSAGPAFFVQERVGQYGRPFRIFKFRSMVQGAETGEPQLAHANDPRITPVGRLMRRFYLDELPQLLNVLLGHMSLVGPRPERQYFIDRILQRAPDYLHILQVRPGMTGWAQVKHGYTPTVDHMIQRLRYDQLYIANQSWWLDLRILLLTLALVARGQGR
jgi:exopolysaccharide biosynthesis polyprenyl glycosylphosphotransferase